MSKGSPAGGLVAMLIVIIFVIIGSVYAFGIHSEHAQGVDINNTSSADLYHSQEEERNVSYTILGILPLILGLGLLVWAVKSYQG